MCKDNTRYNLPYSSALMAITGDIIKLLCDNGNNSQVLMIGRVNYIGSIAMFW